MKHHIMSTLRFGARKRRLTLPWFFHVEIGGVGNVKDFSTKGLNK